MSEPEVIKGRGGHGGIMIDGEVYFPAGDGQGCPACGAIWPGGHGGYCKYGRHFDASGKEVGKQAGNRASGYGTITWTGNVSGGGGGASGSPGSR